MLVCPLTYLNDLHTVVLQYCTRHYPFVVIKLLFLELKKIMIWFMAPQALRLSKSHLYKNVSDWKKYIFMELIWNIFNEVVRQAIYIYILTIIIHGRKSSQLNIHSRKLKSFKFCINNTSKSPYLQAVAITHSHKNLLETRQSHTSSIHLVVQVMESLTQSNLSIHIFFRTCYDIIPSHYTTHKPVISRILFHFWESCFVLL